MKKIALAAAAILFAAGGAFAENPHVGWTTSQPPQEKAQADGKHSASPIVSSSKPGSHPADQYNSQVLLGR